MTSPFPLNVGEIKREYRTTATGSASAAQLMTFDNATERQRLIIEARGDNVVFKFGADNTVAASKTLTGGVLPDGNFSVPSGAVFSVDIDPATQLYYSVIAEGAGGTGIIRQAGLKNY